MYFVGPEHHKIHLAFIRNILGGEYVVTGKWRSSDNPYDLIKDKDGPDVIWFFASLYKEILQHIKGKSISVGHGLGFKPTISRSETRKMLLKMCVHQIWSSGYCSERKFLESGIPKSKIFRIGYTPLFLIPDIPVDNSSIYISVGWFEELMFWYKMLEFIKNIGWKSNVYISVHPCMPYEYKKHFIDLCRKRSNLNLLESQGDLLKVFSFCRAAITGLSSTSAPFFYFKKPVVFIKNRGRYPFLQWQRLRKKIKDPLFFKILSESTKFIEPKTLDADNILNAKVSPSAKKMFYETNWDEAKTKELILNAVANIS